MAKHAAPNANARLAADTARDLGSNAGTTVSRETSRTGAREVFGYMGVAVVFALIGNEIKIAKHPPDPKNPAGPAASVLTESGTIIFGGFTAAAALTLLSHAGEGGRQFAVGLAAVTMLTSVLVYGGPVWKALGAATGQSKPTRGSSPTTPSGVRQTNPTPATVGSTPYPII